MTVSARCAVCKNSDLRRLIELGWNAKMSIPDLVHAFGGVPSHSVIHRHLKEHAEGAYSRTIEVEDARPIRERVLAIQRAQIEAIERQLFIAQQKADEYNEAHRGDDDYDPDRGQPEWYFDILGKDFQSAIASILKAQGLTDKREASKDAAKVDLARAMLGARGGLAPESMRQIEDGNTIEGEVTDV
jgi:hypothetical protein